MSWIKDFFVPPRWLVDTPPGWRELTDYALGGRMATAPALMRFFSRVWLCVALVMSGKARMREWVLTRFWRAVVFIGVTDLFLRTTPMGHWVADNLIRPWFSILAWIFLP
jgi:hypothetical protein